VTLLPTASVSAAQRLRDGRVVAFDALTLAAPLDAALAACSIAIVLLGAALVVLRLR
jgi:hypothetical protein